MLPPEPNRFRLLGHALLVCATLLLAEFSIANEDSNTFRLGITQGYSKRFPDTNGIAWTYAIQYEVFSNAGFKIDVIEAPVKRLPAMMNSDKLDSFLFSKESLDNQSGAVVSSKYPIIVISWYIYYDATKGWSPTWPPDEIFKGKIGKSKESSVDLSQRFGLDITQSASFDSTVQMVNIGRADYWIDNKGGRYSLTTATIQTDKGFEYKKLYQRGLYVFFKDNERGRKLKAVYDAGVEALIRNQTYAQIYYRNDKTWKDTDSVDDTMVFIRDNFPNLEVPNQLPPKQ